MSEVASTLQRAAAFVVQHEPQVNLLGIGIVAGINTDLLQASMRSSEGHPTRENRFLSDAALATVTLGGLAILATPNLGKLLLKLH
jgi:hypothetical protein